jgi:hypothetical protein
MVLVMTLGIGKGQSALGANWDIQIEYPSHIASVVDQKARVVARSSDDDAVRPAYLRALCQRALGLPYVNELKSQLNSALDTTIGPGVHYATGEIDDFRYSVSGNSAECSGEFVARDRQGDLLQIALRVLWADNSKLAQDSQKKLLDLLADRTLTTNDAMAYMAVEADEADLLFLVDGVIDWDQILLDISRIRVAQRLADFDRTKRAKQILDGCKSALTCNRLLEHIRAKESEEPG